MTAKKTRHGRLRPPDTLAISKLHRVLDESLWQIERRRVDPSGSSDKAS